MATQTILLFVIALLGIPAGWFISKLTEEELKPGKKWFELIGLVSFIVFIVSIFASEGDFRLLLLTSMGFIFLLASTSRFYGGNK